MNLCCQLICLKHLLEWTINLFLKDKILKIESVANNYLGKSNQPNFLRSVEND